MAWYNGVEDIPDDSGTAQKVKCPLVDDWIEDIDCLENQDIAETLQKHPAGTVSRGVFVCNAAD